MGASALSMPRMRGTSEGTATSPVAPPPLNCRQPSVLGLASDVPSNIECQHETSNVAPLFMLPDRHHKVELLTTCIVWQECDGTATNALLCSTCTDRSMQGHGRSCIIHQAHAVWQADERHPSGQPPCPGCGRRASSCTLARAMSAHASEATETLAIRISGVQARVSRLQRVAMLMAGV